MYLLVSCGGNYHVTNLESAYYGVEVESPGSITPLIEYVISGSCRPKNATVTVTSPDFDPSIPETGITCKCVNAKFECQGAKFDSNGPNGINPLITATLQDNNGDPRISTTQATFIFVDLDLPEFAFRNTRVEMKGSCRVSGSTVEVTSPDMSPSSLTCPCENEKYFCGDALLSGTGPNGNQPIFTATITAPNGTQISAQDTLTMDIADLVVQKNVDNPTPNEGENFNFEVQLENLGPDLADNVSLSDTCPSGTTFINSAVTSGSYSSGVWSIPLLAVTSTQNLTLTCSPNIGTSADTIINTVTNISSDQADPSSPNEQLSSSITVKNELDIAYTLAASGTIFEEGQVVEYTVSATNNGIAQASNFIFTTACPSGTTYVSSNPSAPSTYTPNSWNIATLNQSQSTSLQFQCQINAGTGGSTINYSFGTAQSSHDQIDTNPSNDTGSVNISILNNTDLELTKTAPTTINELSVLDFMITVNNLGPAQTSNLQVSDNCPTGTVFSNATASQGSFSTGVWSIGALPRNVTASLTLGCTVDPGTSGNTISNTISNADVAMDQTETNPANETATTSTTVNNDADIGFTISASPTSVAEGNNITYTITALNNGPATAENTSVTNNCPTGTTFVSAAVSTGLFNPGTWSIGNIVNGANESLTLICSVNIGEGGNTITNSLTIADLTMDQTDSVPANNTVSTNTPVVNESDIAVTKSTNPLSLDEGQNVTFTLNITNNGTARATTLVVNDDCPTGTSFISATPSGSTTFSSGSWNIGTLDNGNSENISITCSVDIGQGGNTITNTILPSNITMDQTDPNASNNNASASTNINNDADLSLTKISSPSGNVDEGSNITYTITASNNGPTQISSLVITDSCPNGTTFVSSAPTAPSVYNSANWQIASLNAGSNIALDLICSVDAGQGGNTITNTLATADITMDQTDPDNTNDGATVSNNVNNDLDIELNQSINVTTADEESDVSFTLTALNNGPAQASSLTVNYSCPTGTTFVSATPSGSTSFAIGVWSIGTLNDTANATLDLVCRADAGESSNTITNTTIDSDVTQNQNDSIAVNEATTSSFTVNNESDIAMTKTAPATSSEGANITYVITATNNGAAQATSLNIADSCPAGTSFVNATPSGASLYAAGSWSIGTLNNGANETLSLTCSINTGTSGSTISNSVSTSDISMDQTDPNNANDIATANTSVSNDSDISLTKVASATSASEGDNITYSISVTNNGSAQATNLTVTDTCPLGTTLISSAPSGTTSYATGTWSIGTLNNTANESLDLVCNIDIGQGGNTITNTISTSDISMDQTDPNNANDGATASTTISNEADISTTKTASSTTANEGDNITYSLGVTNNGTAQASSLVITDSCPTGTTFVSATPSGSSTFSAGTWTIGTLNNAADETLSLVCNVSVGQGGNTITNILSTADITMDQTDPNNANDGATASTTISNEADISTTKTVSSSTANEGDNITYSLGVTNNGTAQASSLTITDSCPTGTTFVSATPSGSSTFSAGTWTIGTLNNAADETLSLVCNVSVGQGGNTITNILSTADITMDQTDPNNANDGATASTTISNEADISTTKTVSSSTANEGDNITYSLGVTNNGTAQASSLTITDSCPAGTTFVSATPSGSSTFVSGTWTIGTLSNTGTESLSLICSVDVGQGGNTITNTLSSSDIVMDQTDPNNVNDASTASTTISDEADISTTKIVSPTSADEGDNITYLIGVTNNGTAQATSLTITDSCPTGTTFVNATPSGGTTFAAGTWTVGTLNNNGNETLSLVCNINAGTSGTTITNTLSSADIAMDQTDPDNTNDGSSASTGISNDSDISMTKTASTSTANESGSITYSIEVNNNGPAQATNLAITDTCPAGTTFVSAAPSGATTYLAGTWTVGTLANAASETL